MITNTRIDIDNPVKKIIPIVLIVVGTFFFSSNYFFNTFPYSEGWFVNYAQLMEDGLFPYRDFYYYLPPLNALIDFVSWKFSFNLLIIFRFYWLIQRTIIYIYIYFILNKCFKRNISLIATLLSVVLCSADTFDFFGDYNQTVVLVSIVLLHMILNYLILPNKRKYAFAVGITIGVMFLVKQTCFFSFGLLFLLCLTYFAIIDKDRKFLVNAIVAFAGIFITIGMAFLVLLYNNAAAAFIDNVFLSQTGKGNIYTILIESVLKVSKNYAMWIFVLVVFSYLYLAKKECLNRKISLSMITIITLLLASYTKIEMVIPIAVLLTKTIYIPIILAVVICSLLYLNYRQIINKNESGILIAIVICLLLIVAVTYDKKLYTALYALDLFSEISIYFNSFMFYSNVLLLAYYIYLGGKNKSITNKVYIVFLTAGVALIYASIMSGGMTTVPSNGLRITTPFMLSYILSHLYKEKFIDITSSRFISYGLFGTCLTMILICISMRSVAPYPWWGCNDYPKYQKTYSVDIDMMKGIKFSAEDKLLFEQISKIVTENSEEDDIVFGYPYVKIFNVLCNRHNTYSVPVCWYDVVGAKYIDVLLGEIKENPPEIIIWLDIDGAIDVHESTYYTGEELAQRKIVSWFKDVQDEYTLVGQIDNFFVYKRIDNSEVKYTYIQRPDKINYTLENDLPRETDNLSDYDNLFEGSGTENDPYIISNEDDLLKLSEAVSKGKTYEGQYFTQIQDIDCSKIDNFVPIGNVETNNYFAGIYNGQGFSIDRIRILSYDDEDVGLFANLHGAVYNVNLINCWIGGRYVGGIASQGQGAIIENCSVTGYLIGYRVGGIADSVYGSIINCVSVVNIEADICEGISGSDTNDISNCYSNLSDGMTLNNGLMLNENTIDNLNSYIENNDFYNELKKWSIQNGVIRTCD